MNGIYHGPIRCRYQKIQCMWDSAIRKLSSTFTVVQPLCSLLRTNRRPIGSLLSLVAPVLTKFNGYLQFFGKQLACDCGQSKCHAAVLDELICEMVTSGAMTNEGCEFNAALSGGNSILDGSGAPLWYAPSTSSVRTKTQAAWPESWTVLCTEMRSFQCRCFWNMLPDDSVLSQSFKQAGWDVTLSLDTNLNPDFNLQNPFFFAVAVGLLLEGRVAPLNLPPLDAAILVKLVQSQQRVKGCWISIQSQSTASFVWAQADVQCLP